MALKEKSSRRMASASVRLFPDLPLMPASLIDGADGALEWNAELQEFWGSVRATLSTEFVDAETRRLALSKTVSIDTATLTARIANEEIVRASADSAEATARATADATLQTNINTVSASVTAEATARVNADEALARTIARLVATVNDQSASVVREEEVRATADGNLSGKYTLTVAAGDVVTGMNITSASGPGTNISEVTFQTDRFRIYNGTLGLAPFQIVGSKIRFTGNVEIDGSLLLSGTLSLTNLSDRSLANLDSAADTKLAGIATGADVTLSAINGGLSVTGGGITLSAGGAIKGGATNFSTGTGFFLGYEGGQYKFRVGDPAGARIQWDGAAWTVVNFPATIPEADLPNLTNPGSFDITFNTPSGAPSGYWVEYKRGSDPSSGPLTGFPFTVNMANGTQPIVIWAGAPGYTTSLILNTSWDQLFL